MLLSIIQAGEFTNYVSKLIIFDTEYQSSSGLSRCYTRGAIRGGAKPGKRASLLDPTSFIEVIKVYTSKGRAIFKDIPGKNLGTLTS